jgi:NTP pyrophosphatase (non-canonical NTP hydrolase)
MKKEKSANTNYVDHISKENDNNIRVYIEDGEIDHIVISDPTEKIGFGLVIGYKDLSNALELANEKIGITKVEFESEFDRLVYLVEQWAKEKGILEHGTPEKQALKTLEECGELLVAIGKNDREEIADSIADSIVTLIIQAKMQNLDLIECLQSAYDIISKRQGKMVNGQFLKNSAE